MPIGVMINTMLINDPINQATAHNMNNTCRGLYKLRMDREIMYCKLITLIKCRALSASAVMVHVHTPTPLTQG